MRLRFLALIPLVAGLTACGLETFNPSEGDDTAFPDSDADTDADGDSDTDADGDSDSDTDTDVNVTLTTVTPDYGTETGGKLITLVGDFGNNQGTVTIGSKAAPVVNWNSSYIEAYTPGQSTSGAFDVTVEVGGSSDTLTEGFYVFPDLSGTGAMMGAVEWYDYNDGLFDASADGGGAVAYWIDNQDVHWWELYAGSVDRCTNNYLYSGDISVYDLEVSALRFSGGGKNLNMTWDATASGWSTAVGNKSGLYMGGSYDLDTVSTAAYPDFTITDAARGPEIFSISSPSMTGSNLGYMSRSGINLSWNASGADYMLARIVTTPDGDWANATNDVTCWINNDGNFSVPSSAFSSWSSGYILYIQFGAMTEANGVHPMTNASSNMAGVYWYVNAWQTQ
jgi:predicted RecA/RadA family phage recombinase